jgi:hypothetical protein
VKRCLVAAVVLIALALPASASATVYSGNASDGTALTLKTNAGGVPVKLDLGHYEAECTNGYNPIANPIGGFVTPFDRASANRLLDRGTGHDRDGRNRVKGRWILRAHHTASDRWRGSYWTSGKWARDGEVYTRCEVKFRFDLKPA